MAREEHMFPHKCNVAIAAACGHVGKDAVGSVSADPHQKMTFDHLCTPKIVDVRPLLLISPCRALSTAS